MKRLIKLLIIVGCLLWCLNSIRLLIEFPNATGLSVFLGLIIGITVGTYVFVVYILVPIMEKLSDLWERIPD